MDDILQTHMDKGVAGLNHFLGFSPLPYCKDKPPAVLVVPKSFSFPQKIIRAKRGTPVRIEMIGSKGKRFGFDQQQPHSYLNSSRASCAIERSFDEPLGSAGNRP